MCRPETGQRPPRVERPGQEEQRHDEHLRQRHERLYLRYPSRHHYAGRGQREGQQQELADYCADQNGIVEYMREVGQRENDDSLEGRNCRAAKAFSITIADLLTGATSISRRKPNSRSHTIEAAEKWAVNSTDIDRTPG
jgi:hypothetical protein